MEYFLKHIAKSLYAEFGNNLNKHCMVFPGRRAGLYFLKHLSSEIKTPVWAPAVMTINDLFRSFSSLQPGETEVLLFELYRAYRTVTKTHESFDDFYFWGDLLLNDFDDTDKYLADPSKLFTSISDLKKIDQEFGGLTPEQAEIVKQFWINFQPDKPTSEKEKFTGIWSCLREVYTTFRQNLLEKNLAYEGMIFRTVTENNLWDAPGKVKWDLVHFVGFNALNECEKKLMHGLKAGARARFYWDFDNSYLNVTRLNSAGYFLKDNIKEFGNNMPHGWSYETNLSKASVREMRKAIETSSDISQVKLLPGLIGKIRDLTPENAHETAIILSDESLLIPLLTSIPENIPDVNITMGYPIRQTPVYGFIRQLIDLQGNIREKEGETWFRSGDITWVIDNPLLSGLIADEERLKIHGIIKANLHLIPGSAFTDGMPVQIFRKISTAREFSEYLKSILTMIATKPSTSKHSQAVEVLPPGLRNEFIYRIILSLNRLEAIENYEDIPVGVKTWTRILERILRVQSVPFSGEPLRGVQIMGILESRALDFRNLIILSVNEGILPSTSPAASFIPFSIREAFGLPSINHQESVYAYHFYRLLHRAENVTFIYNSNPEGLRSGEMSRFLQQMKYDQSQAPNFMNLGFEIRNPSSVRSVLERSDDHGNALSARFSGTDAGKVISPMAINMWLNCRMKFYYRYVCGLKEPEELTEEIDPAMLGILLHDCLNGIYRKFSGREVKVEDINLLCNSTKEINDLIDKTIDVKFRRGNLLHIAVNELIVRNVLRVYISRVLAIDRKNAPFTIIDLEKPLKVLMNFESGRTQISSLAGGIADRIDSRNGTVRIVDYKTGTTADSITSVSDLFMEERPKEMDGWLQTLLYCEAFLSANPGGVVRPSVYKVKKNPSGDTDDKLIIKTSSKESIIVEDYMTVRGEFMDGLKEVLGTIFNQDEPFVMTTDIRNKCQYCPYRVLCMR